MAVEEIAIVTHAVACSPLLESLCFEVASNAEALQAFADGLCQSRWLKKFHFSVGYYVEMDEDAMRRLLQAFQQNTSLEEISYTDWHEPNFFDRHELAKLERYSARNKALPLLTGKPDLIPLQLWPSVWKSVEACHYATDFIFRSLRALSESIGRSEI